MTKVTARSETCWRALGGLGRLKHIPEHFHVGQLLFRQTDVDLGCQNAHRALVDSLAGEASIFYGGNHGADGAFRVGRHQQHIRACQQGPHGPLAAFELVRQPSHIHGVGDDQILKMQFIAQQTRQYAGRNGGGNVFRLNGWNRHMSGHDGVHAVRDRCFKRLQFDGVHVRPVLIQQGQTQVTIRAGIAVAGKMFHAGLDSSNHMPADHGGDELGYFFLRGAVSAHPDDRVLGIGGDIGYRTEVDIDSDGL